MEDLLEMLGGRGSGSIQQLARQFGISDEQAESAVRGLAPALSGALGKNSQQPGGLEALKGALTSGNHGRYVDDPGLLESPDTTNDGNAILGHLLGSKDESRRVAAGAAEETGLDLGMLKQMLPLVASLLMGSVGRRAAGGGLLGESGNLGGLGELLGGLGLSPQDSPVSRGGGGGGLGSILGKLFGRR